MPRGQGKVETHGLETCSLLFSFVLGIESSADTKLRRGGEKPRVASTATAIHIWPSRWVGKRARHKATAVDVTDTNKSQICLGLLYLSRIA